jgi:hypothetical protein
MQRAKTAESVSLKSFRRGPTQYFWPHLISQTLSQTIKKPGKYISFKDAY